jgi:hypothetical protein
MAYWDGKPAARENIRLFEPPNKWRRWPDDVDPDTKAIRAPGCARTLEGHLTNGMNATNLAMLAGAGSARSARNADRAKLSPPGWQELWDAVHTKVGKEAFDTLIAKLPNGQSISNIEKLLTQCKLFVALYGSKDGDGKTISDFITNAETAILARVDFVDGQTELTAHETLLLKVARRGLRKPRMKVFTTNYDLCFEYAAQRRRFIVVDGFSHAAPQIYDRSHFGLDIVRRDGAKDAPDYLENVFQLFKLHGSLDWRRVGTDIVRSRAAGGEPVLIFPRDSKYQEAFDPPYLDMMGAFQSTLREPDTALVVAGFGFNDNHLGEPILAALESNMSFRLIVCDPAFLPEDKLDGDAQILEYDSAAANNEYHKKLLRLAQTGDQRLVLLNGRFEDLTIALPDLVAQTERERHVERVRALRELDGPSGAATTA